MSLNYEIKTKLVKLIKYSIQNNIKQILKYWIEKGGNEKKAFYLKRLI